MGRKRSTDGTSKSEAIRNYFRTNPDATPKQVAGALREQGIDASPGLISNVKSTSGLGRVHRKRVKKRKGRKAAAGSVQTARSGGASSAGTGLSAQDLFAAKQFADRVGGLKAARKALDTLEQLR